MRAADAPPSERRRAGIAAHATRNSFGFDTSQYYEVENADGEIKDKRVDAPIEDADHVAGARLVELFKRAVPLAGVARAELVAGHRARLEADSGAGGQAGGTAKRLLAELEAAEACLARSTVAKPTSFALRGCEGSYVSLIRGGTHGATEKLPKVKPSGAAFDLGKLTRIAPSTSPVAKLHWHARRPKKLVHLDPSCVVSNEEGTLVLTEKGELVSYMLPNSEWLSVGEQAEFDKYVNEWFYLGANLPRGVRTRSPHQPRISPHQPCSMTDAHAMLCLRAGGARGVLREVRGPAPQERHLRHGVRDAILANPRERVHAAALSSGDQ